MVRFIWVLTIFLTSCSWAPRNKEYREYYSYLNAKSKPIKFVESDYFVVLLVSARHLDYFSSPSFLRTLVKHPSDGSLNGDVGHAWVYLQGKGEQIEGGHSGELGIDEPKYFDGVMDLVECGDANPIRYMQHTLKDGFFQNGSGGHIPTYAVKIDLTLEQYKKIKQFIYDYDYRSYSLIERQCVSFVAEIALIAGLKLETEVTMPVSQFVTVGKYKIKMWQDPAYNQLTLLSPDALEKSMMRAGNSEYALDWYLMNRHCTQKVCEWTLLPKRVKRVLQFH